MARFLLALVVIACVVLGVGFYLGWFRIGTQRDATTDQVRLTFDVNAGKIAKDAKKGGEAIRETAAKVGTAVTGGHQVKGKLAKIDETDKRLTIRTDGDKTLTVQAAPATKIRRNGVDVQMDNLAEGDEVQVLYREENGNNVAQTVTVKPGTE